MKAFIEVTTLKEPGIITNEVGVQTDIKQTVFIRYLRYESFDIR